jgi:flagellar FliL protein
MSDKKTEAAKPADGAAPSGGGLKAMLPLILNVVLMPVIAYVMTVFVLLPKINSGGVTAHAKAPATAEGGHGEAAAAEPGGGGKHGGAGGKTSVPLGGKVLVNVSGTAGTRYLLAAFTLVGAADLKEMVDKSDAQLRDVASSVLATKTITDLDKPGSRNLIRTELISAFNGVLGEGRVKEIYFTEFAIQ